MLTSELCLRHAAELFCAAKTAEGLSPRSITWYRMILDRSIERFGPERPVEELTSPEMRAWLVELRRHLAPVSVAGYVRGLRAIGNWLANDGLAEARSLRTLARPRVPHKVIEPLSDADLRRLLAAAADPRDRAILLLLLDTGLRVSEAAGITLGDLRADAAIKVMGKGSKERIVPVGGTARRAIGRYLQRRGRDAPDEPLFLNQSGERLTLTGIQQLLERLKNRSGVAARCNPHTFRHTFARNYLMNGATSSRSSGCSVTPASRWSAAAWPSPIPISRRAIGPPRRPTDSWRQHERSASEQRGPGFAAGMTQPVPVGLTPRGRSGQPINRGGAPVDGSKIVVQQIDIATGHLERRGAMAEDPLKAEHVTAVLEKRAGEGVTHDMG
jgi:integrase/recombinase XerD